MPGHQEETLPHGGKTPLFSCISNIFAENILSKGGEKYLAL